MDKKESETIEVSNMPAVCKCGNELVVEERKQNYTIIVSAVNPTVEIINTYGCKVCHTVVSRKRIFNKAEVLKAIENLNYEDRVALIAGELASGEKIQPKYDDDDEINDNLS